MGRGLYTVQQDILLSHMSESGKPSQTENENPGLHMGCPLLRVPSAGSSNQKNEQKENHQILRVQFLRGSTPCSFQARRPDAPLDPPGRQRAARVQEVQGGGRRTTLHVAPQRRGPRHGARGAKAFAPEGGVMCFGTERRNPWCHHPVCCFA